MTIQIFGRKKCFETKKALRYFKERGMKFSYVDLDEKPLAKGELNNIKKSIPINELINEKAKEYKKLNLDKIRSTEVREEILLKNPKVINTPIIRSGNIAILGLDIEKVGRIKDEK